MSKKISARKLHKIISPKSDFYSWIMRQIEIFRLRKLKDFETTITGPRGVSEVDYLLKPKTIKKIVESC